MHLSFNGLPEVIQQLPLLRIMSSLVDLVTLFFK